MKSWLWWAALMACWISGGFYMAYTGASQGLIQVYLVFGGASVFISHPRGNYG